MTRLFSFTQFCTTILEAAAIGEEYFNDPKAFDAYKTPIPIHYKVAEGPGTCQTLEGPVGYEKGHRIMTGVKGEHWPVSEGKFMSLYDDQGNGTATPKKVIKRS